MVDLSISHISNIETGKTIPSLEAIAKIAKELKVSIDELVKDGVETNRAIENSLFTDLDEVQQDFVRELVVDIKNLLANYKITKIIE